MTTSGLNQTWDLDVIFQGGSTSTEFDTYLAQLSQDMTTFSANVEQLNSTSASQQLAAAILHMQDIAARLREAGAFISCLTAQDVKDTEARLLVGRVSQLRAKYNVSLTKLDAVLTGLTADAFAALLDEPQIGELQYVLEERRRRAGDKLPPEMEALVAVLSVDGYGAWGELYNTIVGRMTLPFEENGKTVSLSMGQANNKLLVNDRDVRERVFGELEKTWANEADLCSEVLNHLAGHRLAVYEQRGWDSVLREPLEINRMSATTLDTMWQVIAENQSEFVRFLEAKAKCIGTEKPTWADVAAPLGQNAKVYTYEEARDFIVRHFEHFNPEMAAFAYQCFEKRWIEAEDRPGKRPGGFCTSFPVSGQTRIFVTFSGSASNVATLAHELGHAYHQHVMRQLPQLNTNYAMNVAETASTFAEMIVADASVKEAANPVEQLGLLEDKVGRSVAMFMNIYARFLFETRFYEERKRGVVSVERLNALMQTAQEEAFGGALASYHPHFWASKLHFYSTGVPFYNFPYTFGYLFSTGIYARAQAEGPSFAAKYVALLQDTGRMRVEDLAKKHLGVDLQKPDFWQSAVDLAVIDARKFVDLAQSTALN
ncbi:M3 family oligoendopeptidase [Alicyclobacillus fodiniaquatilis]|uniref:M3 family oligoendopeptidase n=1 Tax=Alicyclobacillus fodiniaquatilis TaxID=1661150 RepID=A0ABW4JGC2_9BACL